MESLKDWAGKARAHEVSFAQERLWFLDRLAPGNATYTISEAMRLRGHLDLPLLHRALRAVVARHEGLRTRFNEVDGRPSALVDKRVHVPIARCEYAPGRDIADLLGEEARRPFNLPVGPLIRVSTWELGTDDRVLLLTVHHIVADAWSVQLILDDLATAYVQGATDSHIALPRMLLTPRDVAAWQRWRLQSGLEERELLYWRQQLEGAPARLDLPTDQPRLAVLTDRGGRYTFTLDGRLRRELESRARAMDASFFMLTLAAFAVLLGRYSRQQDLVIGVPVSGRDRMELERMVACLVNSLPVRIQLGGARRFRDLVVQVRETVFDAHEHQRLPFDRLVEAIARERSLDSTPIFQVMCSSGIGTSMRLALPAVSCESLPVTGDSAKFDLTLLVDSTPNEVSLTFEYRRDLMQAATVRRLANHLETMLRAVASDPELAIVEVPVLTEAEAAVLVTIPPERPAPEDTRCLHELFQDQVQRTPKSIALTYGDSHLSYSELESRSNQLAHSIQAAGVGRETLVGVCLDRGLDLIVGLLGVLKAGASYVPLDPTWPTERLLWMLRDSCLQVVVAGPSMRDRLPPDTLLTVVSDFSHAAMDSYSTEPPHSSIDARSLAYVMYTSGSTGRPKAVAVSHASIVALFAGARRVLQMSERDVWTLFHSCAFDFSVWEMWGALLHGGRLIILDDNLTRSPRDLLQLLRREHVTVLSQTPSAFAALVAEDSEQALTDAPPVIVLGGEAVNSTTVRQWLTRYQQSRVVNMYGITETTVHTTARWLTEADLDISTGSVIGSPLDHAYVRLLDERLRLAPIGVPAEIYVGGAGLARGYMRRPDLTAERFVPDPFSQRPGTRLYRSGDLARWRSDGQLEFLGRADRQLKIRGFRVEPREIEETLASHPSVRLAAVFADGRDALGMTLLVAYVVKQAQALRVDMLRNFLRERLPAHMIPSRFMFVPTLPLSPSGKLDRERLPRSDRQVRSHSRRPARPRTTAERGLARIWSEVLSLNHVGLDDNFFDLGGHSLLATQLIARIRRDLDVDLPIQTFFAHPTIASLAEQTERLHTVDNDEPHCVRIARSRGVPLSPVQERFWEWIQSAPRDDPNFIMGLAQDLRGLLDIDRLSRVINILVGRHESLRTTFRTRSGHPVQVVMPRSAVPIRLIDLRARGGVERERAARGAVAAEFRRPFDLSRGPLFRATLIRLGPDRHVLVLVCHHLVADGWSLEVLWREAGELLSNPGATLGQPLQYADYSVWARSRLSSGALEDERSYWEHQLDGAPATLQLPTDFARPSNLTLEGGTQERKLTPALTQALRVLSRGERATMFSTLLAGWATTLRACTGQDDLVIGSVVAGRTRVALDNVVGCFVNTLPLRVPVRGQPTFRQLIQCAQEVTVAALGHQELPLQEIERCVAPGVHPYGLIQVHYALHAGAKTRPPWPGVSATAFPIERASSQFDLDLVVDDMGNHLSFTVEYKLELFKAGTIRQLLNELANMLQSAVGHPDDPLPLGNSGRPGRLSAPRHVESESRIAPGQ